MGKSKKFNPENKKWSDGQTTAREVKVLANQDFCNCKHPFPIADDLGEYCENCGKEI
jgi:hypothetical protein